MVDSGKGAGLITLFTSASFTAFVAFSMPNLLNRILPTGSQPNAMVFGISANTLLVGYWVFYAVTSFFPTCLLSLRRLLVNDNEPPTYSEWHTQPRVSVIVPAYNEEDSIAKCLDAITNQSYNGEIETIVVNDGSTDATASIASKYPVKLINLLRNRGKGQALNSGVRNSSGEILVFTDSDSSIGRDSVRLLAEHLSKNRRNGAVAGFIRVKDWGGNMLTRFQAIEYETGQQLDKFLQGESDSVIICPGPLFAARRDVALRIPFNEGSVTEDADFTARVHRAGIGVGFEPQAIAYTNAPISLKRWIAQRKRWWAGFLEMWKTHKPWSSKNLWMINSYISYVVSIVALAIFAVIPLLTITAANPTLAVERAIVFGLVPLAFFMLFTAPFLLRRRSLLLLLPLCGTIYFMMKAAVLAWLYVRYICKVGVCVSFGSRIMKVNW